MPTSAEAAHACVWARDLQPVCPEITSHDMNQANSVHAWCLDHLWSLWANEPVLLWTNPDMLM